MSNFYPTDIINIYADDKMSLLLTGFSSVEFVTIANKTGETGDPWGRPPVKGFGISEILPKPKDYRLSVVNSFTHCVR
jgi:hypothetical protein